MRRDGQHKRALWVAALALVIAAPLAGCAGDDGDPQDSFDIPEPFIYADVPEPYPAGDVAACKAFSQADEGLTEEQAAPRECLCDACIELMRECDALEGCAEIRRCAQIEGCNDPYSCYLFPNAPCAEPIDRWGNASVSTAVFQELGGCNCL